MQSLNVVYYIEILNTINGKLFALGWEKHREQPEEDIHWWSSSKYNGSTVEGPVF